MDKGKKITEVHTRIVDKEQHVFYSLGSEDPQHQISYSFLQTIFPQAKVTEVEFLEGSTYHEIFYKRGEVLSDGQIVRSDNHLKSWNIVLEDIYATCVEKNKPLIREFQTLMDIKLFPATESRRSFVLLKGDMKTRFLQPNHVQALSGLEPSEFHLLKGSYMTYDCYKKGDRGDNNRGLITADEKILRLPIIRTNSSLLESYNKFIELEANESGNLRYRDSFDEKSWGDSYDQYGGPSDGYGGHLSDDFINDALGGEPGAIWNID